MTIFVYFIAGSVASWLDQSIFLLEKMQESRASGSSGQCSGSFSKITLHFTEKCALHSREHENMGAVA